jgi:hypothetical protein
LLITGGPTVSVRLVVRRPRADPSISHCDQSGLRRLSPSEPRAATPRGCFASLAE